MLNAIAVIMVASGWQIYNASPIFGSAFPSALTLGGCLAGETLLFPFAAMWLLAVNGLFLRDPGASSHWACSRAQLISDAAKELFRDFVALRGRLAHVPHSLCDGMLAMISIARAIRSQPQLATARVRMAREDRRGSEVQRWDSK